MSDHWNSLANLLGTPNLKPRSKKSREEDVSTAPQSTPATTPNPAALHEEDAAPTPTPPAPTSKPRGGRGASKKQVADQGAKDQSPVEQPEIQSFGGDLVSEETPAVQPEESKRGSRRSPRGNENRGSEKGGNEKGGRQRAKRGEDVVESQEQPVVDVPIEEVRLEPQIQPQAEVLPEVVSEKAPSVLRTSWDAVANFFGMGGGGESASQESQKAPVSRNEPASRKEPASRRDTESRRETSSRAAQSP